MRRIEFIAAQNIFALKQVEQGVRLLEISTEEIVDNTKNIYQLRYSQITERRNKKLKQSADYVSFR